jgi:anaerobic selenocysteine-containing dehydrogenase
LSRGQPCDFSGIRDYAHLESAGGVQWPFTATDAESEKVGAAGPSRPSVQRTASGESEKVGAAPPPEGTLSEVEMGSRPEFQVPQSTKELPNNKDAPADPISASRHFSVSAFPRERRLFSDGRFFTSDGRARFIFDPPQPMPEPPDREYPFLLLTGRGSSAQWHTGSRTDKSAVLRKLAPTVLTAEINVADAERLHIANGDRVRITSRRGEAEAVAVVTATIDRGQIFLPMHFEAVNRLTHSSFDPHSRQPAYKACAVALRKR